MNRYFEAFRRMSDALVPISKEYNRSCFFFYIDALYCRFRYGVTPNQYIAFAFYKYNHTVRRTFYTARLENRYDKKWNDPAKAEIFWDKQIFNNVFSDFVNRDWLFTDDHSAEEIQEFIKRHKEMIIVKPTDGSSGKGIHLFSEKDYAQILNEDGGMLLEELVCQHKLLAALNPTSVNTIRIYTAYDGDIVEILSAMLRIGGAGSVVDNYHSGGVAYPIDPLFGYVCGKGTNVKGQRFGIHPSTNMKVVGFQVPNWDACVAFVKKAARVVPEAHLIAWDIAVLEDGFELIEGNYAGDSGMMQSPLEKGTKIKIMNMLLK